jgi:hypothetical protein
VVNAAAILAAECTVERRHARVLEERREVRARAERIDAKIFAIARFSALLLVSACDLLRLRALPHGEIRFRIDYILLHIANEAFQRV